MEQADHAPDEDQLAPLALPPADGAPADTNEIRDLMAIPPEFRPACGRPGSHVTIRQVPVTVPHALCDLTGVILSYPGRGGATVPDSPGSGVSNSMGIQVQVDAHTQDVTVTVSGADGNA